MAGEQKHKLPDVVDVVFSQPLKAGHSIIGYERKKCGKETKVLTDTYARHCRQA